MSWTNRIGCSVLVAAILLSGSTAVADQGFVELHPAATSASGADRAMSDESAIGGATIHLGYAPEALEGVRGMIGYSADGFTAPRFDGDMDATWQRNQVLASADYSYELVGDWLGPLVRGGVGYSRQSLQLGSADADYRGTDNGFSARIGAGLEISLGETDDPIDRWDRLSVGVNALVGYAWQTSADFDEMETTEEIDEDEDPWQRTTYDAGSMQISGVHWGGGINLRYQFGE